MSQPEDKYKPDIPDDYFNKLNLELGVKLEEEEIFIAEHFPVLFTLKKDQDFSIPNKYLHQFELSQALAGRKNNQVLKLIIIAASILVLVSIFALSKKKEKLEKNEINSAEIINYFAIENEDLEDLIFDDFSELLSTETETRFTDIKEEVLFDFLLEDSEQLDLDLLY